MSEIRQILRSEWTKYESRERTKTKKKHTTSKTNTTQQISDEGN